MYAGVLKPGVALSGESLSQLRPHDECRKFGEWVVLLSYPRVFLERLAETAAKSEYYMHRCDLVTYYDNPPGSDTPSEDEAAFRKERSFSWQSEYRVIFSTRSASSPAVWTFETGDISDIAHLFRREDFCAGTFRITSNH
jgi:hypothetical protein